MEDLLQKLFVDVVNMSITASYVIILVLLARLCLKKAPRIFAYSLWIIVLFRLVCPFTFSSSFSFLQMAGTNSGKMAYIPSNIGMMAQPQINTGINSVNSAINASLPAATPFSSANPMQIILSALAFIWAAGIVLFLLYSVAAYLRLKYRVRTAMLVENNIFISEKISFPFVLGMIKPRIYLPTGLNDTQSIHILKHEEIHIRRRDYLIKPIAFLTLCVHWFNPLVWISFVLMTKDMEMSCDERALKELGTEIKQDYSTSLLSMAINGRMVNAGPLAFGESNVKSRIKNVLNYKQPAFWIVIAAAVAVVCVTVGLMSNPQVASIGKNDSVQEIYQYRTPYLGDNSKVGNIVHRLPVPKTLNFAKMQLFTDKAPYVVEVDYQTTPAVRAAFAKPDNQTVFDQNAVLMFALIGNTESVKFVLNDGQQDLSIQRTRGWANEKMAQNVWESSATFEKFASFVNMLEPPKIAITAAGIEINYMVGLNHWNTPMYGRGGIFQTIMHGKSKTDLPYIKLNQKIQIAFEDTPPDSVKLQDYILQADGNVRYSEKEIQTIPIEFKNGKGSFVLAANPAALLSSDSSDYEPGAIIRGFRLTCKWGKNECEYAFIIRSDAR